MGNAPIIILSAIVFFGGLAIYAKAFRPAHTVDELNGSIVQVIVGVIVAMLGVGLFGLGTMPPDREPGIKIHTPTRAEAGAGDGGER